MKKSKTSITIKVLAGYILLFAFGAATVWFVYNKIVDLNKPALDKYRNKKISLIGEVATRLYATEGISKKIIQDRNTKVFLDYHRSIDTIYVLLDSLKINYSSEENTAELDSISYFLELKEKNLKDLLAFRRTNVNENYYTRVLKRLEKEDYLFGSTDYKSMAKDLKPYQQKVLIDYLKYAEKDNANRLTNQTADSLINTMKDVLLTFAMQEDNYQKSMAQKEANLLVNDQKISHRLAAIRSRVEQEEIKKSLDHVKSAQKALNQTSKIMIIFGISCVITILFFVVLIIRDTNRSRRYRKELEKAKAYAEDLLKSREQIMATVTHDLRSPLNSILGFSNLIEKGTLKPKQKQYLQQIKESSDFTMRLVNDLLDYSRLESGNLLTEALPFIPENIIRDAVNGSIPSDNPKNLSIEVNLKEELSDTYISDPFRIKQILMNLVGNAYKFTEKGKIIITGRVTNHKTNSLLHIDVQDSGIGISKAEQKLIFQEFSQVKNTDHKRRKGFGLGLSISQRLAGLLRGRLTVESEKEKGSTFSLSIPIKLSEIKTSQNQKSAEDDLQIVDAKNLKILVVDDNKSLLKLTVEILGNQGFIVATAIDGKEALEKIQSQNFDLIITDIQMPRLDGYELINKLKSKESTRQIPIIALSGEGKQSKTDYLEKGFIDYILKPYKPNYLLHTIAQALNLKIDSIPKTTRIGPSQNSNKLYDLEGIKQFIVDNPSSLKNILKDFIKNTSADLKELERAEHNAEYKKIGFIAHKMLGMMYQIKANKVIEPLVKLESGKAEKLEHKNLKKLLDQVIKETHQLMIALKDEL